MNRLLASLVIVLCVTLSANQHPALASTHGTCWVLGTTTKQRHPCPHMLVTAGAIGRNLLM